MSDFNRPEFHVIDPDTDFRLFLIPIGMNSIAHYIAMHDDLYCHNIYNYFKSNLLLNLMSDDMKNIKTSDELIKQVVLDIEIGKDQNQN